MDRGERPPGSGIRYVPARRCRESSPIDPIVAPDRVSAGAPDRACRWRATAGLLGAVGGRPEGRRRSGGA